MQWHNFKHRFWLRWTYGGLVKDYFKAVVLKNIYFIWDTVRQCQTMWLAAVFPGQTLISWHADKTGSGAALSLSFSLFCVHAWLLYLPQWASLICMRVTLACLSKCHFLTACACISQKIYTQLQHAGYTGVCNEAEVVQVTMLTRWQDHEKTLVVELLTNWLCISDSA